MEKRFTFEELQAIVATLRSEHGCPWDKAQTHESIKPTTLEEAYEVNQAVTDLTTTGNPDNLIEELGDLLLQILFHCRIAEEKAEFTIEDVVDGIATKMIRRHPHVFGQKTYDSVEEQQVDWETIKAREHHNDNISAKEELEKIPAAFPALIRSQKAARKIMKRELISAADEDIFKNMLESVVELQMAAANPDDQENFSKKLGKALFSITWLAAKYRIPAEIALNEVTDQFIQDM